MPSSMRKLKIGFRRVVAFPFWDPYRFPFWDPDLSLFWLPIFPFLGSLSFPVWDPYPYLSFFGLPATPLKNICHVPVKKSLLIGKHAFLSRTIEEWFQGVAAFPFWDPYLFPFSGSRSIPFWAPYLSLFEIPIPIFLFWAPCKSPEKSSISLLNQPSNRITCLL